MKTYFKLIKYLQGTLLSISIGALMILPILIVFRHDIITNTVNQKLYLISHLFLFFVMTIRPLSDIFIKNKWMRPLVILRKGTGVVSASIVVSFILAKLMVDPTAYLSSLFTLKYWSMVNYAVLAHLADLSAVILLITSNNYSKRILGDSWKKIQRLSYLYFYGSVLYVYLSYESMYLLVFLIFVTFVTFWAFIINRERLILQSTI